MNFLPIMIMNAILLAITILLSIADRFLVNYGACKITVTQEDEKKEFIVEGGGYLHAALIENNFRLTTSCGGKATCGYCKVNVLSGGGPILPTEEIFMSRKEKADGIRLACQVKVKKDIEIFIPDFLTTVRNIVEKGSFDPKINWRFNILNQKPKLPEEIKPSTKLDLEDETKLFGIIEQHREQAGSLVPVLQEVNGLFNYLPEPALTYISGEMNIPLSMVYRIATFYNAFSLKPRGRHIITVCLGTACHVKGAANIVSAFERELGIKIGGTTGDMLFTLEGVRCIGCCGLAPVLKVNEDVHGLMHTKKVLKVIESYQGA
ncbi:MAG: NAD(P)H-dependent oxidoreductase subunit E [Candidatus Latescibacterota bacterium]